MRREVIEKCISNLRDVLWFQNVYGEKAGKLRYVQEFLKQELEAYKRTKVLEVNPSWYKKQV